jgi:hypothetical protein
LQGECRDNAVAESFFSTLKRELEGIDDFESRAGATLAIGDYIDGFRTSGIAIRSSPTPARRVRADTFREESSVTTPSIRSGQPQPGEGDNRRFDSTRWMGAEIRSGQRAVNGEGALAAATEEKDTQMRTKKVIARAVCFITLFASVSAFAAGTANHVSKCQIIAGGGTWTTTGGFDNTSLAVDELWCPVDYTFGSAPTTVTASVFSNGCINGVGQSARVCVVHAGGGAASCGGFVEPTSCNQGMYQLPASVPTLTQGDYLILDVWMLVRQSNADNVLFGYTAQ